MEALQVRDVSRNVERVDLPFAAWHNLVAESKAFNDQAALRWAVLVPKDVLVFPHVPHCYGQGNNRLPLVIREGRDGFEPHDERMCGRTGERVHCAGRG